MDNILDLDKKQSVRMLSRLSKQLFNNGIYCKFDNHASVSLAATGMNDDGYAVRVVIGMKEIANKKKSFPFVKEPVIPDANFVNVVINMYHEHMHCIQKNQIFRKSDMSDSEKAQTIQELACMDNPEYYIRDGGNYFTNASEIQAEQYGILHAYNYLCEKFPDVNSKQCECIILNIVNQKMTNSYFVKQSKPFESLDEVIDAFDNAYTKSFAEMRNYNFNRDINNTKDISKKYILSHPKVKNLYTALIFNPRAQDKLVAAINLKFHPEWYDVYPKCVTDDISYEKFTGMPFDSKQSKQSERIQMLESEFQDVLSDTQDHDQYCK